ncbi:MAG: GNAT family N-acetyltransferase [Labilithrix sp.]|nr:GNAT family N-acetyltransferase [Labilithrix sp.]
MGHVFVRGAVLGDVGRLVELNHAAYPDLVEDGVVFDAAQLTAQLAVFPEGQRVAVLDGRVVGSIATLIVPSARALAPHTWGSITSQGTFACHDPRGDVLYLADVYADPAAAGRGVGPALYEALFDLCARKGLARVVAGGRLWGYHEVAGEMTAQAYADDVIGGARRDRVLTSQLRAGFSVAGILDGYLDDWRSGGYATHLVWENERAARSLSRSRSRSAAEASRNDPTRRSS